MLSEKLYPRSEDPEVAKFGDFCAKYYKELFGQNLPLWQRSFLEHCYKSKGDNENENKNKSSSVQEM